VSPREAKGQFRSDIEGLRGVAVLFIVAFHVGTPGFRGGFIGVDVFFVLSGYLITRLLVNEIDRSGRIDLPQFYARRVRRLLPGFAIMSAVVIVAAVILLPPLEQSTLSGTALAASAYCSNFVLIRQASDYFAPNAQSNPLLHTWSLGVEEQFYLVWPLLILLGYSNRRLRNLIAMVAAVIAISLAASIWLAYRYPPWGFYGSPARAWEFGIGGLTSLLPNTRLTTNCHVVRPLGWLGLAALAAACVGLPSETGFPRGMLLIPVLGTSAMLISGAARLGESVAMVLSLPLLRSLGKYSYAWYLWHWPILSFAQARLSSLPLLGRVLCAFAALGLAVLSTRWVEHPILFYPRLIQRTAWSLGLAVLLTLGGIGISGAWRLLVQRTEQFRVFVRPIQDVPRFYQFGCMTPFLDARLRECAFGDVNSSTTVVLLGDSHAAQWFPALETISNQNRWRLVTMVKMACPAVFLRVVQSKVGRQEQQCAQWREAAIKRIREIGAHAAVVATSTEYPHVLPQEWLQGTRMLAQRLTSSGVQTLFMRDTPHAPFAVPQCMAGAAWRGSGDCNLIRSQALDETVFGIEQVVARSLHYVWNIDLSDRICGPDRCEVLQGGRIILRDRDHLAASYVENLAPALAARIVPLISMKTPALGEGR
jgi:peptidoglycan/LPS O-acetylase OafA/YrhL